MTPSSTTALSLPLAGYGGTQNLARAVGERRAKELIFRASRFEIEAYNRLVSAEDRREGVRAFIENRPPQFNGK